MENYIFVYKYMFTNLMAPLAIHMVFKSVALVFCYISLRWRATNRTWIKIIIVLLADYTFLQAQEKHFFPKWFIWVVQKMFKTIANVILRHSLDKRLGRKIF